MSQSRSYEQFRQERDSYLERSRYLHPVYGSPLKEPYKRSNGKVVVTYKGQPVNLQPRQPNAELSPVQPQSAELKEVKRMAPLRLDKMLNKPSPLPGRSGVVCNQEENANDQHACGARVYHAFRLDPRVLKALVEHCKASFPRIPMGLFVEQAIMEKLRRGTKSGLSQ